MKRRRGRRRTGRGARPGKVTRVSVERNPKGSGGPVRVKIVRRRNGVKSAEEFDV